MKLIGRMLSWLGLGLGAALGIAIALPTHFAGLSWLIAVGMAKLAFASSLGLIAAGAVVTRIGARAEERRRLARGPDTRDQ